MNRVLRASKLKLVCSMLLLMPMMAQAAMSDFTLARMLPADAFFAVSSRSHDGMAFLQAQNDRVMEKLKGAKLDEALKSMLKNAARDSGTSEAEFEQNWDEISTMLAQVEWETLFRNETAFAMRIAMVSEMVMLTRVPADKVAGNYDGFKGMIEKLASLDPSMIIEETQASGVTMTQMSVEGSPFPMMLVVAKKGDVLMLGMGSEMVEQTIELMMGNGSGLVASSRFKQAFSGLPEPQDAMWYMDWSKMTGQLRGLASQVMDMSGGAENMPPKIASLPDAIIGQLDLADYGAGVVMTSGMKTVSEGKFIMRSEAKSLPLYKAMFNNKPLNDPFRFVPKNAGNVTVTSGVDLEALYTGVMDFIEREVPDGEMARQQVMMVEQMANLSFKEDIFGWMGGNLVTFDLPGKTRFSPPSFAMMISVKDEAKGNEMLGRLMEVVEPMLAEQQGSVREVDINGATFYTVQHPMMMMMAASGISEPLFGITQGQLVIASGRGPIEAALNAQTEGTFADSERYQAEGLPLSGPVTSVSFTDQTQLGEQLAQAMSAFQMMAMFPEVAQNPAFGGLIRISQRLAPVMRELNYFQSTATVNTYDGTTLRMKSVMNYRDPA